MKNDSQPMESDCDESASVFDAGGSAIGVTVRHSRNVWLTAPVATRCRPLVGHEEVSSVPSQRHQLRFRRPVCFSLPATINVQDPYLRNPFTLYAEISLETDTLYT